MYNLKHYEVAGLSTISDENEKIIARIHYHDFDTDEEAKEKAELITDLLNNQTKD